MCSLLPHLKIKKEVLTSLLSVKKIVYKLFFTNTLQKVKQNLHKGLKMRPHP